jgi:hypothetical protein
MSSILIRPSATETVRSVSANTGRMISLTRAAPFGSAFGVFDGNGGAQDIVGRNASALPAEFVATVRPANPFQDAITDQSLKHRLKPWRKLVPGRQCLRRNRAGPLSITAAMAMRPLRDINGARPR